MTRLQVNTDLLIEAGGQLRGIVDTFMYAQDDAETLADKVGHRGLAGKVRDFAQTWQSRREEMLQVIGNLGEVSEGVGIAFEEWDQELANALTLDPEAQEAISQGAIPQ